MSKVSFVSDMLHEKQLLFINLTETWLDNHNNAELQIDGYKVFKSNRNLKGRSSKGRSSGGVASYLRDDFAVTVESILEFSNGVVETQCLYSKKLHLVIVNLYRQPDSRTHRSTSKEFHQAIKKVSSTISSLNAPSPDIIITGDFNLPHVNWLDCSTTDGITNDERQMFHILSSFTNDFFLTQVVHQPTHYQGNTLDLVFTNNKDLIFDYNCIDTLQSISHHKVVEVSTKLKFNEKGIHLSNADVPKQHKAPLNMLNFHNDHIDWTSLNEDLLSIDWTVEFKSLDVDQMFERFLSVCHELALKYVPPKKYSLHKTRNVIPKERRKLMTRRKCINKRLLRVSSPSTKRKLKTELIEIEKKLVKSQKTCKENEEHKAIQSIRKNSKYFFAYAKRFSKLKNDIGPLIDSAENVVSDSQGMADLLASQFSNAYSHPKSQLPTASELFDNCFSSMNSISFTEEDLLEAIDDLKLQSSTSALPDGFPSIYLKKCKHGLVHPLYLLWAKSLRDGSIPSALKNTIITPLFKKGNTGNPDNYRPIASSSHIIKVFEKVVKKYLLSYLEENEMLNPSQHGFRCNRSCLSQLLSHYETILRLIEEGQGTDVIYLDFSKAFDKVDFGILLSKLKKFGIGGSIAKWIYSFLTNRIQRVLVNGFFSIPIIVESGVIQGSVLGPLLFILMIGDIDQNLFSSVISSFADDTRVLHGICEVSDCSSLQSDLDAVYSWAIQNNMQFNGLKFELIRYNTLPATKNVSYVDSNKGLILEQSTVKDLGILMSNTAKFTDHINNICSSIKNMSSWILRTFMSRSRLPMITLWKTLVIPIHDYCSQLWSPLKIGDIQKLELLQWYFIKKIKINYNSDYWSSLSELNLLSLQRRRERYQIIYLWKIIENIVPNPNIHIHGISHKCINVRVSPRMGRSCIPPNINRKCSIKIQNLRSSSFCIHACKIFNVLPKNIRDLSNCNTETFKANLDAFLQSVPDTPHIPGLGKFCQAESNSLIHMVPLHT